MFYRDLSPVFCPSQALPAPPVTTNLYLNNERINAIPPSRPRICPPHPPRPNSLSSSSRALLFLSRTPSSLPHTAAHRGSPASPAPPAKPQARKAAPPSLSGNEQTAFCVPGESQDPVPESSTHMATATTAKPSLSYFLNNPCHNCRRRRLRCDRSRPSCNKCSASGRECLGYDKLFVWTPCAGTKGAPGTSTPPAVTTPGAGTGAGAGARRGSATGRCSSRAESRSATNSPASSSPGSLRGGGAFSVVPFTGLDPRRGQPAGSARQPKLENAGGAKGEAEPTAAAMICMPTTLTDPLFKDLDQVSRRYLSHCLYLISFCLSSSLPSPLFPTPSSSSSFPLRFHTISQGLIPQV